MRVLIVDDQRLFAEAVQVALADHGVEVTTAGDGATAMSALERGGPHVVLVDVELPDGSGIDLGRRILERGDDTRVIALTAGRDPSTVDEVLRVGFSGYLTKDTKLDALVNAIRVVFDGEVVVSRDLAPSASRRDARDETSLLVSQLTSRELQVLELLTGGKASEEIALALHISRNTLRTHVQSILAKLGVHSRLEAAAFAVRHGLFPNGHPPGRTSVSA
jgi:two-component system nitrate/nitrite response regulator NarL